MPEGNATNPAPAASQGEGATQGAPAEKTFTQSEMDAIIGDRLKRERQKYSDYDDLKAKAAEYDKAQEASKSELQRAIEQRDALQAELGSLKAAQERAELVAKVAAEKGVSAEMLSRMSGDVEENAAFLAEQEAKRPKYGAVPDAGETRAAHAAPGIPTIF